MSTAPAYTRLPGQSRKYFGLPYLLEALFTFTIIAVAERCRVYRGSDHLLVLRRHFFTETAHRFYFSDIQAITVQRTAAHAILSVILLAAAAGLAACVLLSPAYLGFSEEELVAIAALSVAAVLAVAVNILFGPTCVTELHTAVYREPLPCLARWRAAQKFLEEVRPPIEAVQVPTIHYPLSTIHYPPVLVTGQYATPRSVRGEGPPPAHGQTRLHAVFFGVLLFLGVSSALDLLAVSMLKNIIDTLFFLIALIVGCVAAARQRKTDLPNDLRAITGFALATLVVLFYVSQFIGFFAGFLTLEQPSIEAMLDPKHPAIRIMSYVSLFVFTTLGLLGLMRVYRFRVFRERRRAGGEG